MWHIDVYILSKRIYFITIQIAQQLLKLQATTPLAFDGRKTG